MTDQEMRIAIAEECGWIWNKPNLHWLRPDSPAPSLAPPDYVNDLNAMHEAETGIDDETWKRFRDLLIDITIRDCPKGERLFRMPSATARQRAEAFLRTLGKWKDSV